MKSVFLQISYNYNTTDYFDEKAGIAGNRSADGTGRSIQVTIYTDEGDYRTPETSKIWL